MALPCRKFSGHEGVSRFLSSDDELSVFRSFRVLGSRNLLYLQSELLELEKQLGELDDQDVQEMDMDILLSTTCWETFSSRAKEFPREAERMVLINRIKEKTKEYYEALLLYRQIGNLPKPSSRVFGALEGWFQRTEPFVGTGAELLSQRADFVALSSSQDADFLTRSLQHLAGRYMPVCRLPQEPLVVPTQGSRRSDSHEVKYYSARHVSRLVTVVTVLAASLVIEGAIVCLYVVESEPVRLGLLAVFTSLFAASLAVMTDGRRSDIVLATAACAAILVVFVSQN